ncbi:hypothetical protein [Burkholderia sp. MS389]|uniref:hypothetical protein n=1 Tax=Burkholderia sp. MS389 TaxID=2811789 RepID=UPI001EF629E3|nr:hypothetical protein [Burkholderia sp. MS389]
MKDKLNTGITKLALGVAMCAALTACGGVDSSSSDGSDSTSVNTTGTVAVGSPIVGGNVTLTCASGTTASASTGTDGTYSVTLKPADYPCVARAQSGQANGTSLASALHSVAAAPGTTNITPLTDLVVGVLGNGNASALDSVKPSALGASITADALANAKSKLIAALATLPGKPTLPSAFDPLTSQFKAAKGDAGDNLLESYAVALSASGLTQADAASDTASGTAMTQQAYAATAFTTPGITAIRLGSSVNLDGTFAIAIADPNRGQYVAKANIDSNGNVTSFTNPGPFTAVLSVLGNRVGQLCTSNGVGSVVASHPGQYVYVSSDLIEVTDLNELNGKTFDEYEDCVKAGKLVFANGTATFTDNAGHQDAPDTNIAQALTDAGRPDPANHSVMHAKVYKYTANGITKYAYITVNSTTGADDPLTYDADTKYVTIGLSQ